MKSTAKVRCIPICCFEKKVEWGAVATRSLLLDLSGILNMQWIGTYLFGRVVDTGSRAAVNDEDAGHERNNGDNTYYGTTTRAETP
jgi:hypothetical protein